MIDQHFLGHNLVKNHDWNGAFPCRDIREDSLHSSADAWLTLGVAPYADAFHLLLLDLQHQILREVRAGLDRLRKGPLALAWDLHCQRLRSLRQRTLEL